jgi:hypothetical protein
VGLALETPPSPDKEAENSSHRHTPKQQERTLEPYPQPRMPAPAGNIVELLLLLLRRRCSLLG